VRTRGCFGTKSESIKFQNPRRETLGPRHCEPGQYQRPHQRTGSDVKRAVAAMSGGNLAECTKKLGPSANSSGSYMPFCCDDARTRLARTGRRALALCQGLGFSGAGENGVSGFHTVVAGNVRVRVWRRSSASARLAPLQSRRWTTSASHWSVE
jgi:hypothetical protein